MDIEKEILSESCTICFDCVNNRGGRSVAELGCGHQFHLAMDGKMLDRSQNADEACLDTSCSICLEILMIDGERSVANLCCGHKFHLDCIGSAFNAKGAMQCPNCRKVEKGTWLFAKGKHASAANHDIENWIVEGYFDISLSDLPIGFWYPYEGVSDEEYEPHQDVIRFLRSQLRAAYTNASSLGSPASPENNMTYYPRSNLGSETFTTRTEAQIRYWQQNPPISPLINTTNRSSSGLGTRSSRSESSDAIRQQRYPLLRYPLIRRLAPRNTSINASASASRPLFTGERRRDQIRSGINNNTFYEPLVPYSILRDAPNMPSRDSGQSGTAPGSSSSSSSLETLPAAAMSAVLPSSSVENRIHSEPEGSARNSSRYHGGNADRSPLPWIPFEGDARWWAPFRPDSTLQPEGRGHSDNGSILGQPPFRRPSSS